MARRTGRRSGVERWERTGVEALEGRQLLAAPVIESIAAVGVPAGKSLFVPVRGSDADGDSISYSVSSDSAGVQVAARAGHPYLRLSVQGFGDLEFQLFDDLAPETVRQITTLVGQDFYDNLTFHRVIPGFVIQGGDPNGDGSGGPGFQFDDEFNAAALFTGDGQLAMANSGKDTNGSQFFVTLGSQRPLDFNHTIFGQLVRGDDVAEAIANVPRDSSDRPSTPVVITDARIVANASDTVLFVHADPGAGPATITVTATDDTGATSTGTFAVDVVADAVNDPPILVAIGDQATVAGTPLGFDLSAVDLEGDPVEYQATLLSNTNQASVSVSGNRVTVTPQSGFTGTLALRVGVKQQGASSRGSTTSPFDSQEITVTVSPPTLSAEGVAVSGSVGAGLLNVPVARFTSNGGSPATAYSATITWGDGSTSGGSVVSRAGGGFEVLGSHSYASAGSFPVGVAIAGPGGSTASASATSTISAPQSAALGVTVTDAPDPAVVGGDVTYTVVVRNTGTAAAQGVMLVQSLPAGATFVSSSVAPSSQANGQVTISLGDLDVGASRTVTIVARPTVAGTFSSTARVTGQGIAEVSSAAVTMVNAGTTDPTPGTPARVSGLLRVGVGLSPTRVTLTFDGPMDRARAEDERNYRLVLPGHDGRMGSEDDILVPIDRASYDEASHSVTLEPRFRLPYTAFARLLVRSGGATGLTDPAGVALDGDGQAGGSFVARFGRGVYLDRAEVLRESQTPSGARPLRLVVRAGGEAFRVGEIAPLFAPDQALARFRLAAGITDAAGGTGGATASAALDAGSDLPRGPLDAIRKAWRRG